MDKIEFEVGELVINKRCYLPRKFFVNDEQIALIIKKYVRRERNNLFGYIPVGYYYSIIRFIGDSKIIIENDVYYEFLEKIKKR
jgi:hypothetical protein